MHLRLIASATRFHKEAYFTYLDTICYPGFLSYYGTCMSLPSFIPQWSCWLFSPVSCFFSLAAFAPNVKSCFPLRPMINEGRKKRRERRAKGKWPAHPCCGVPRLLGENLKNLRGSQRCKPLFLPSPPFSPLSLSFPLSLSVSGVAPRKMPFIRKE